VVALGGLATWFALRRGDAAPEDKESVGSADESPSPAAAQPTPEPSARRDEAPAAPAPPQQISPDHQRIRREGEILGTASDAVDLGDAGKLRLMAKTYRAQNFEGAEEIASGYEIIAECLDHPGPISKAPAKYYDDNHRASILRPFLRKACFPAE
jgi:hypothetical protein